MEKSKTVSATNKNKMGEGQGRDGSSKNVNFQGRQVLRQVKPNNWIPKYRGQFPSFIRNVSALLVCQGLSLLYICQGWCM